MTRTAGHTLALWLVLTFSSGTAVHAKLQRKMVADWAPASGRRRLAGSGASSSQTSTFATYIGTCTPETPVTFPVSAGSGKGMVGLMDDNASAASNAVALDITDGTIDLDTKDKQANVFTAL